VTEHIFAVSPEPHVSLPRIFQSAKPFSVRYRPGGDVSIHKPIRDINRWHSQFPVVLIPGLTSSPPLLDDDDDLVSVS
jgi:hypothetical protein